ncbi:ABC transporter ATP-binding protein [Microbacterium sp. SORGH_AS_0862]|uniref:ABC transporter ATP-binding protein n=1 Tax=Microbacterium sp. SORGH_AS_0862 TaxID=3041789 RepID=UPI0027910683|nr:ABC transporter ATP-binding protein [Microbacterium sp. SORGH_AS_0862]MDQ1206580.1 ABC-2 type transport system ATP-binding protein [Microbacterium sp. SORGH_AS_0862]
MTSTPSGSDAPTPDDGSAEEVSAAPKKPASARPSTPRTPRSTTARPAAARKPAAKKPAASSASAAVAPDEKEPAAPAAPKKPATKRPTAAKRPAGATAEDAAAPAPAKKAAAAPKKPAAPRKPAARTTTARTGETAAKPRTASPRTKSAQAGAKTSRTTAAKTPPVAPVDAPVPVDFVIPPKPPLPPRPAPSDADQPTAIDEVIVPDQAPVEPASPEVLDEVPVVAATDAAIEEATPEPADVTSLEPVETVEEVTVVEVVEEVPEEAPPVDDAGDPTPDDAPTPAEAEVVVVTERAEDEAAERLFADVARADEPPLALEVSGLAKSYGATVAVAGIDLAVPAGTFYGLVGPNGAGKTTTLSMIAGLLKPDAGTIRVAGVDARTRSREAKKLIGVLPDRLRTFDRLTGRQLLSYAGLLRGLDANTVERRASDLGRAFDLTAALGRSVSDYSAGMTKKVMLAAALIHSPRLLVLDEPFEAVDPVSSSVILDILGTYVSQGGTVLLSSHGMDLVERVCDRVAVIVSGQVLVDGTVAEVRGEQTLEARFLELVGGSNEVEGLEWLHTFSD